MPVQAVAVALDLPLGRDLPVLLSPPRAAASSGSRSSGRAADVGDATGAVRRQSLSPISTSPCWARSSPAPSSPRPRSPAGRSSAGWRNCSAPSSSSDGAARPCPARRDRAAAGRRGRPDPVPRGHQRRRQPHAAVQERPVQRRRAADRQPPARGPAGVDRLYPARRHADRARFRPFFAWYGTMALAPHLWRMLGLGWPRSRWSSTITRRPWPIRLAQGAGGLLLAGGVGGDGGGARRPAASNRQGRPPGSGCRDPSRRRDGVSCGPRCAGQGAAALRDSSSRARVGRRRERTR